MSTQIFDVTTIILAVHEAEKNFLGLGRTWRAANPDQKRLLELYSRFRDDVTSMEDLKAKASKDIAVLNAFLAENGFDIRLDPIPDPEGFGVVAILDRLVKWLVAGEERSLWVNGKTYPAFRLEEGASFYSLGGHQHPAVCLQTQSKDTVWLTFADEQLSGLALVDKVLALAAAQKEHIYDYKGTVIPEVMINQKPDISFLLDMGTYDPKGQYWFIQQAIQQAKFAMNKEGARIKVATAVAVMRSMSAVVNPDLIFDRPFYLWISGREGSALPVAMIYVDVDTWQKADLNAL